MYQYRSFLLILALLAAAACTRQDAPPPGDAEVNDEHLSSTVDTTAPTSSASLVRLNSPEAEGAVMPGSTIERTLTLHVAEGWHINAHQPRQEYLIGTTLSLNDTEGLTLHTTRYPEPELIDFSFADDYLAVYTGRVPIQVSLQAADTLSSGVYSLKGHARVQACSDRICLAPDSVLVEVPIEVATAEEPPSPGN